MTFKINKYTFAHVAIYVVKDTICVAKLAAGDINALALVVARLIRPVRATKRGRIAVQPVEGSVRRRLVKSYPAFTKARPIAIIHNTVTSQTCTIGL